MRRRAVDVAAVALVLVHLVASAWLVPGEHLALPGGGPLGELCWFHAVFHHPCPLCGMTRSFTALAHGDLAAALRFHPAGPLLFAAMLGFAIAALAALIARRPPLTARPAVRRGLEAVVAVCIVTGAFQMTRSW